MQIRMLKSIAGAWTASKGDIVDRPEAEALRLVEAGIAATVEPAPQAPAKAKKVKGEG